MSFLLDTNLCSAHLRRPSGPAHRVNQHSGRLYVSSIVLAELYILAYPQEDPAKILDAVETLLSTEVVLLPFDKQCAEEFGKIRGDEQCGGFLGGT